MVKYNINTCDQIHNEFMVHFTKACENKCAFCIDAMNKGIKPQKPDVDKIFESIYAHKDNVKDVTISGGEPCLYMEELFDLVTRIKEQTTLNVNVISSLPTSCWTKRELFFQILEKIDGFAFSPQHYKEDIADKIRGCKSKYNHQTLYKMLPHKEKMCVNINLIKGYLDTKEEICKCINHYNKIGFTTIKVAELFDKPDLFVSFENIFNLKLKKPFSCGCKTVFDITPWIPTFKGTFILKRTCFMVNKALHASFGDLFKIITRPLFAKNYSFGVIYENGEIKPYWC